MPMPRIPDRRPKPKANPYGGGGFGGGEVKHHYAPVSNDINGPHRGTGLEKGPSVVTGRHSNVRHVKNPTKVNSIDGFLANAGKFLGAIAHTPITPSAINSHGKVRYGGVTYGEAAKAGAMLAAMGVPGGGEASFGPAALRMSPQLVKLFKFLRYSPYGHMIQGQAGLDFYEPFRGNH